MDIIYTGPQRNVESSDLVKFRLGKLYIEKQRDVWLTGHYSCEVGLYNRQKPWTGKRENVKKAGNGVEATQDEGKTQGRRKN